MLETERLILRPLDKLDVDAIYRMRGDADVMRFIREPQNRRESTDWVKLVSSRWAIERIGFCAMLEKPSGVFVGWCGIWRLKEIGELEIGYAVAKEFWGKGLAAEAAFAFLDYAFDELNQEKIVAVARPENAASRRVMEKLGMSFVGTGTFYEQTLVQYAITKEEHARNRKTSAA
jgi:ribosomal-protein-alanine N-acetyltransferase